MADELNESGLTPEEEAYFETEGQGELPADPPPAEGEQPEAPKQEGDGEPARDEKGRFVPHQALHAEREEHKRTKAELQELRDFRIRMEERARWAQEAQQKQAQPEQQPILDENHPDYDIFKAQKWLIDQNKTLLDKVNGWEQQTQQAREQQEMDQKVWSFWQQDTAQFAQQTPDFGDAAKWMAEQRDKQLQAFGTVDPRFANPQVRNQTIDAELKQIVIQAAQQGRSPAELVYTMAKSWGYSGPQNGQNGQQQPLQLPGNLQQVQQAQQASRTVAQAPGSATGNDLTMEQILAMDRGEFEAWIGDPKNARYYDKLMGSP